MIRTIATPTVKVEVVFEISTLNFDMTFKSQLMSCPRNNILLACQMCAVIYGGARKHMYDITYEEDGSFQKFANIDKQLFFLAVGSVKVSICLFNLRLTSITSKPWIIFSNIFLFLFLAYIMVVLF